MSEPTITATDDERLELIAELFAAHVRGEIGVFAVVVIGDSGPDGFISVQKNGGAVLSQHKSATCLRLYELLNESEVLCKAQVRLGVNS